MNDLSRPPVRSPIESPEEIEERIYSPQGQFAPRHSLAWANYTAACIAAREVRGLAMHSEAHRLSLAAWERGERAWPWPDSDIAADRSADAAMLKLVNGHKRFIRDKVDGLRVERLGR